MSLTCEICGRECKDASGLTGHMRLKHGNTDEVSSVSKPEPRSIMRAQPLDVVIENLRLPQVPEQYNGSYNIYVAGFNDGVMHGARSILAGIRAAQELSAMGVQQAVPLIRMAQEMRQAEGQAAQTLAAELGQATIQGNREVIAAIHGLAEGQSIASSPDPMAAMMAETMKPVFGKLMQTMLRMTGLGAGAESAPGGQPQSVPGQPAQAESWSPPNIKRRSRDDFEEQEDV